MPLSMIFNLSLQEGVIPDVWELASVVPVFKKGQPGDPCNYRPIFLSLVLPVNLWNVASKTL